MKFRRLLILFVALAVSVPAAAAPPTPKKSSRKAPSKKTNSASARKNVTSKKSASGKKSSGRRTRRQASARGWRSGQQQPAPERYREIQQALADKGYLQGPPTGTWGPESVNALKRFQRDQNLKESGTLDSLSIIALGLGPKRASNTQTRSQP